MNQKQNAMLILVLFCSNVGIEIFHKLALIFEYFVDNQRQLLVRLHHPNLIQNCNNIKCNCCNIFKIMTPHQMLYNILPISLKRCVTTPYWCMVTQFQGSLLSWNNANVVVMWTLRSDDWRYDTNGATAPDFPNNARLPIKEMCHLISGKHFFKTNKNNFISLFDQFLILIWITCPLATVSNG